MNISDFQKRLLSLRGQDFENFVFDVLQGSRRFSDIKTNVLTKGVHGQRYEIDILAIETPPVMGVARCWAFEITARKMVAREIIQIVSYRFEGIKGSLPPNTNFVLIVSGQMSAQATEFAAHCGLEIWDAKTLFGLLTPEVSQEHFQETPQKDPDSSRGQPKADSLRDALLAMPKGKSHALEYQHLCGEILEYLFCPPLEMPQYELSDEATRNRRDLIFENSTSEGWWAHIRNLYSAHYIVVDAKNYTECLEKRPVLDIAHYLKTYGCGLFGILVSRKGPSDAALHAIREHWIGEQKMVVVLSDSDVIEMLRMRRDGGRPEEIIRQKIGEFRMKL